MRGSRLVRHHQDLVGPIRDLLELLLLHHVLVALHLALVRVAPLLVDLLDYFGALLGSVVILDVDGVEGVVEAVISLLGEVATLVDLVGERDLVLHDTVALVLVVGDVLRV